MLYKIFSRSATRTTAATQAVVYNRQTKRLNLTKVLGMLLFAMPLVTANGQSQVAQPVAFDPLTVTAHQERAAEPSNASQTNTLYITEFPRYNAVWRPSDSPEIQVYGSTYEDYRKTYDELRPQGWRLYSLDTYPTTY